MFYGSEASGLLTKVVYKAFCRPKGGFTRTLSNFPWLLACHNFSFDVGFNPELAGPAAMVKWCYLDSNLHVQYGIASSSLGHLNYDEAFFRLFRIFMIKYPK